MGHTFGALPCIDANGQPTANDGCAYSTTARTFVGCVNSGCHATQQVAASALTSLRTELATLGDQIWVDGNHNEKVDAPPTDQGLLPQIVQNNPGALNPSDDVISPADGAEFNMKLFGEDRYENGDKSHGVHNPFLAKALLAANIAELQQTYGVSVKDPAVQALVKESIEAVQHRQPELLRGSRK